MAVRALLRWFRILLLAVLAVAAVYFLDWNRRTVGLLSRAEITKRVKAGDAIVQAVYDYRTRTGAWPKDAAFPELVRAAKPEYHWHYQHRGDEEPPVATIMPAMHTLGTYRFPRYGAGEPGPGNTWVFSGDSIRAWQPVPSMAVPSAR